MDSPTDDIETLRAALAAERTRAAYVEAELALARAKLADDAATIAHQKLEIAKLKRQIYGPRSERTARLIEQMELELEELEATATEDEIAAEQAAARTWTSPDLVESLCLLFFVRVERGLESGRAHVAQARMPPARVIEAFDVLANGVACLPA